jgi:hypothetical protein
LQKASKADIKSEKIQKIKDWSCDGEKWLDKEEDGKRIAQIISTLIYISPASGLK